MKKAPCKNADQSTLQEARTNHHREASTPIVSASRHEIKEVFVMTVIEILEVLSGPDDKLTAFVEYDGVEYDVTRPSPVRDAFANYVVHDIWVPTPHKFVITPKTELVKRAAK